MIYVSNSAQAHFSSLLLNQETGTQIRAFVNKPGTSDAEVGLSYCPPNTIKETDIALRFEKLTIYVDELSMPFLEEMEIDFISEPFSSQLILKAPNIKIKKKKKDSTLAERVQCFLQSKINPQLAAHNGQVFLKEITNEGYAILQFGGNCHGCSMINITLKEGIEKQLLKEFSELIGVRDFRSHQEERYPCY